MATDELRNEDVRYETSDIAERGVVVAGASVFASLCVILLCVYFVFAHYAHKKAIETPGALPMMHDYGRQLPPEPRLQRSPERDLTEMRAEADKELHGYRWIDQSHGVVAMPIERAIDLTAQRGVPAAPVPAPNMYSKPEQGDPTTGLQEREQAVAP